MAQKNVTTDPELYNFEKFLVVFSIIGVYLGIIVEQKYTGTHIYPMWNQVSFVKQIAICLFTFWPIVFPMLPYLLIDKKKHSYVFVMIFKKILPPLLGNF